jgi:hypothetical protein
MCAITAQAPGIALGILKPGIASAYHRIWKNNYAEETWIAILHDLT